MSPRKLSALLEAHCVANGVKSEEEANDDAFKQLMKM
jgi:hypothetical protein